MNFHSLSVVVRHMKFRMVSGDIMHFAWQIQAQFGQKNSGEKSTYRVADKSLAGPD